MKLYLVNIEYLFQVIFQKLYNSLFVGQTPVSGEIAAFCDGLQVVWKHFENLSHLNQKKKLPNDFCSEFNFSFYYHNTVRFVKLFLQ